MTGSFDEIINRENTDSLKWDYRKQRFGSGDIIPMWVADMDFKSPDAITREIIKRAKHGVYGYTQPSGMLSEAVIGWLSRRHNWSILKDWVIYSPGVVTSVNTAILALTEKGDKILMQTPIYYPFYSSISQNLRELVTNSLIYVDGKYEMDFEDLEKKFAEGVKMMIFCSPHNPIGRVWKRIELERVSFLCEKYNVILISDEIHADIVYEGNKHIPFASLNESAALRTITLISPTKTFNLAGLSQSCAIIENDYYSSAFKEMLNKTGAGMLNIFGLVAAQTAYSMCDDWLRDLIYYLQKNLDLLENYFEQYIPSIKVIRPEATYLVWLDCNKLPIESQKLKKFFTIEARVGLNDGITFGEEGKGFQRLNFGCPEKVLLQGLERIRKAVDRLP